jgi:Mg2+-importing ATPase
LPALKSYWSLPPEELLGKLNSTLNGLSEEEAQERIRLLGENAIKSQKKSNIFMLLLGQFKSPIILILILAAILSFFLRDPADASIILSIVFISGLLGFWQEKGAANAVEKLLSVVQIKSTIKRGSREMEVLIGEIVTGDIVVLSAGSIIPGDCRVIESKDFFLDEAALTGETYPVEKFPGILPEETVLAKRTNCLYMGTHVVSGTARAVVVSVGKDTEFGKISEKLKLRHPETEFERGVRRFGYFLMEITLLLVVFIFGFNVYFHRPILDSLMFALALAVGLTPQLLPTIISINLAHGARRMAEQKVIVKKLNSIENFGSMTVLCSDKTGTLTEGQVRLQSTVTVTGQESEKVSQYAYLNAIFESGFLNPIDEAIRQHCRFDTSPFRKIDEIPYDFIRKRLSILVAAPQENILITKGALKEVLEVCTTAEISEGKLVDLQQVRAQILYLYEQHSSKGYRTLGIAYKMINESDHFSRSAEAEMTFLGLLFLYDPVKPDIQATISELNSLGVAIKMITGDNKLVAENVAIQVGITNPQITTGSELRQISDEAMLWKVTNTNVFAEVEPNQKERIILALKKAGEVPGYLGDGINDATALHAADVGISVNSAVDVAKEAADIVLLEHDLKVLTRGVREGRLTFANTLKYVFMATSANFGNMFSMAGASLFLPFLPLLPRQILLTNLLTDFPEMAIASDRVDREMTNKPRRWNIGFIRKFMTTFGLLSSIFDCLTFALLMFILHSSPEQFRSGWFIESVVSAGLIVLVIRSRRPFWHSKPGNLLQLATFTIIALSILLPFSPIAHAFGFVPLPLYFLAIISVVVVLYMAAAEGIKILFYKKIAKEN